MFVGMQLKPTQGKQCRLSWTPRGQCTCQTLQAGMGLDLLGVPLSHVCIADCFGPADSMATSGAKEV